MRLLAVLALVPIAAAQVKSPAEKEDAEIKSEEAYREKKKEEVKAAEAAMPELTKETEEAMAGGDTNAALAAARQMVKAEANLRKAKGDLPPLPNAAPPLTEAELCNDMTRVHDHYKVLHDRSPKYLVAEQADFEKFTEIDKAIRDRFLELEEGTVAHESAKLTAMKCHLNVQREVEGLNESAVNIADNYIEARAAEEEIGNAQLHMFDGPAEYKEYSQLKKADTKYTHNALEQTRLYNESDTLIPKLNEKCAIHDQAADGAGAELQKLQDLMDTDRKEKAKLHKALTDSQTTLIRHSLKMWRLQDKMSNLKGALQVIGSKAVDGCPAAQDDGDNYQENGIPGNTEITLDPSEESGVEEVNGDPEPVDPNNPTPDPGTIISILEMSGDRPRAVTRWVPDAPPKSTSWFGN